MVESEGRPPRLLPPRALLIALLVQVPALLLVWPPRPPGSWLVAGGLALLAGAALNLWADSAFKRGRVPVCPFKPVPALVEEGPYRYSRNPMYLGMVLICASLALLTRTPVNLLAAAAYWVWLRQRFVIPEEAFLREQVGERFQGYADRIPRWIGWPAARA